MTQNETLPSGLISNLAAVGGIDIEALKIPVEECIATVSVCVRDNLYPVYVWWSVTAVVVYLSYVCNRPVFGTLVVRHLLGVDGTCKTRLSVVFGIITYCVTVTCMFLFAVANGHDCKKLPQT